MRRQLNGSAGEPASRFLRFYWRALKALRKQSGMSTMRHGAKYPNTLRICSWYSVGGCPTNERNFMLKDPRLAYPTSKHTSVTDISPETSKCRARSILRRVRNSCGVWPKVEA